MENNNILDPSYRGLFDDFVSNRGQISKNSEKYKKFYPPGYLFHRVLEMCQLQEIEEEELREKEIELREKQLKRRERIWRLFWHGFTLAEILGVDGAIDPVMLLSSS